MSLGRQQVITQGRQQAADPALEQVRTPGVSQQVTLGSLQVTTTFGLGVGPALSGPLPQRDLKSPMTTRSSGWMGVKMTPLTPGLEPCMTLQRGGGHLLAEGGRL